MILPLLGFIIIYFLVGLVPAILVALFLLMNFGLQQVGRQVARSKRGSISSRRTIAYIILGANTILVVLLCIGLFLRLGWIPGLGYALLFIVWRTTTARRAQRTRRQEAMSEIR